MRRPRTLLGLALLVVRLRASAFAPWAGVLALTVGAIGLAGALGASTARLRETTRTPRPTYPVLVPTGDGFGLAWDAVADEASVYFLRLDRHGHPIGTERRIGPAGLGSNGARLAWSGSSFAMSYDAWHVERGTSAAHVVALDAYGAPLAAPVELDPGALHSGAALAWTGRGYGVAWLRFAYGAPAMLRFRVLDARARLDGVARDVRPVRASEQPALAWTGADFVLAQSEGDRSREVGNLHVVRLDERGAERGTFVVPYGRAGVPGAVSIATAGARAYVAWAHEDADRHVFLAAFSERTIELGPTQLTGDSDEGIAPSIAWSGSGLLLGFEYARSRPTRAWLRPVDRAGRAAPGQRLGSNEQSVAMPSVCWDGSSFAAAWVQGQASASALYFGRFDAGGRPLSEPVRVAPRER